MDWKKIGVFVLIFVVLLGISNVLFRFILPIKAVSLVSRNMEPTYHENDVLFWKLSETYEVNDVVVYKARALAIDSVSRIINLNEDGTFQLKGDANPTSIFVENRVLKQSIKGKVIFSLSPFIFYGLTYGIIFALSFLSVRYIFKKKQEIEK